MLTAALLTLALQGASAQEVGRIGLDVKGNDIVVEAFDDPKVEGVTCHVSHFDRGALDKLVNGNWFENPSNSSISCRQTGPIVVHDVATSSEGEVVFSERASLIFKVIRIRRIVDYAHNTLIYVDYSSKVTDSSAKNSLSTVSLLGTGATLPPKRK
jgi:CreA protein